MKIKPEHYEYIKQAIEALPRDRVLAHKEALKNDARVKDLDKRFRWDLLFASQSSVYIADTLYNYMDDKHIDTALRAIVKDLGL
jgi:hypothetical protein